MQYPLYVHRNGEPRYRGSLPDFPGADASGNSFEELERNRKRRLGPPSQLRINGATARGMTTGERDDLIGFEW